MSSYKSPDLTERRNSAAAAKKAMLERHRAALQDPEIEKRRAERTAINEARVARLAEREVAKKLHEAELARQAAEAAERALEAEREAQRLAVLQAAEQAERDAAIEAEKKAERDARYAARKAAKKARRAG
jgi:hypothetical protein